MHALALTAFDGPAAVSMLDLPNPVATADGVVVAVEAAGIGTWDAQTTHGAFAGMGGLTTFPQVLGWDLAGTVAAVGENVSRWSVGDPMLGFSAQPWTGAGAFAQLIAVDSAVLAPRPATLDAFTAAAFPVTALTADLAVLAAAIGPGDSVLVLGAAGSVGSLIVQLARAAGATVIASVSLSQSDLARDLGAETVVDRAGDVTEQVLAEHGRVDAIIDAVGPAAWSPAIGAVRPAGHFVTVVPPAIPDDSLGLTSTVIGVQPDAVRLRELAEQLGSGALRIRIADVVPLSEGSAQLRRVESGGLTGKLVLDPAR